MLVDIGLLLFGPALGDRAVVAELGFGSKLAHDEWFLRKSPMDFVGIFGSAHIPAYVLVEAYDIECVGERIVENAARALDVRGVESGGNEARGV